MMSRIISMSFFMAALSAVSAQTYVQNFSLINVADGTTVTLDSYPSCSGLAVIFTSNACPYDLYYTERLRNLVSSYKEKIQFVLINAHPEPAEAPDLMKAAYEGWSLPIPYLSDKDQTAMDNFGARKSPEVFLLKRSGEKYTVTYHGALDDNPQAPKAVTDSYLKKAIDSLLTGQEASQATRPVGCSIRKK